MGMLFNSGRRAGMEATIHRRLCQERGIWQDDRFNNLARIHLLVLVSVSLYISQLVRML